MARGGWLAGGERAMFEDCLVDIIDRIVKNYDSEVIAYRDERRHFPSRQRVKDIIKDTRNILFPRFFEEGAKASSEPKYFVGNTVLRVGEVLYEQVREALLFRDGDTKSYEEIDERAHFVVNSFFMNLPTVQDKLLKDVEAAFDGDPAAQSREEIIFTYPGFFAVTVYRIAHELYLLDVPLIPRFMTEYAHAGSGVDLNAGAEVGEYFFIDHATGVVIGETTRIGNHVKIYQGVTLGALSTRGGQKLKGVRRHPTIEDNVTIYSNASVLGGDTVIGEGSIISGSAFVTKSVPPHSRVTVKNQEVDVRVPKEQ